MSSPSSFSGVGSGAPHANHSGGISGIGYGTLISLAILLIIISMTLVIHYCRSSQAAEPNPRPSAATADLEEGIDDSTLASYPTVMYAEAKSAEKGTMTDAWCSICLSEYKEEDVLRLLPECGHLFHSGCVDAWLRQHPTCPVCRSSPLPCPTTTPLAEVVPLASEMLVN